MTLPPGRCLQGSEICRLFRIKPEPASEENIVTLEHLHHEYEKRVLWKVNEIEGLKHDKVCSATPMRLIGGDRWCQCRTRQEEVHEWEDWIAQNFGRQEDEIVWMASPSVYSRVSS